MTPAERWYVVQTRANSELKASMNLRRQGFGVYLPRYLKSTRHARRARMVAAPLFPRYLFVEIDVTTQRWRAIQSTIGVSHFVMQGDAPASVGGDIITGLQSSEDKAGYIPMQPKPLFNLGDQVRVLSGPFASSIGVYDGMADGERVAVLFDLLGRKVSVAFDGRSVVNA
jgi:transcriptional antiterminator RfaH